MLLVARFYQLRNELDFDSGGIHFIPFTSRARRIRKLILDTIILGVTWSRKATISFISLRFKIKISLHFGFIYLLNIIKIKIIYT